MEREGRGREGEMRRGRRVRGIIVGGMALLLVFGCNNGGELEAQKRLGEIGKSVEKIFYSFIELVSGVFNVNENTTRDDVKHYFTGLANRVDKTIQALSEIGNKIQQPSGDEQKSVSVESSSQEIENAKKTLSELKGHIEALKDIGDSEKVVRVDASQSGQAANKDKLEATYSALKEIVNIAIKEGVKAPEKSKVAISDASLGSTTVKNGAKVLAAGANAGAAAGPEAAAIVSSVSGKEILAAIVASDEETNLSSGSANGNTSAKAFAKGSSTQGNLVHDTVLAGAVSGGIALRSLVKDGKLASNSSNDKKGVEVAGISATNKLLGAIEDIVRETVKKVLDKAKVEIDKARDSKTASQQ